MRTFIREFKDLSVIYKICLSVTLVLFIGTLIVGLVVAPWVVLTSLAALALCFVVACGLIALIEMFF